MENVGGSEQQDSSHFDQRLANSRGHKQLVNRLVVLNGLLPPQWGERMIQQLTEVTS